LFEAPEEYEALNRQTVLDAVVEKKRRPPERFVNLRMPFPQHIVQPGLEKEPQGDTSHENAEEVRHQRPNCILGGIQGRMSWFAQISAEPVPEKAKLWAGRINSPSR